MGLIYRRKPTLTPMIFYRNGLEWARMGLNGPEWASLLALNGPCPISAPSYFQTSFPIFTCGQVCKNASLAATTLRAANNVRRTSWTNVSVETLRRSSPATPLAWQRCAGPSKSLSCKNRTVSATVHDRIVSRGVGRRGACPDAVCHAGPAKCN